MKEPLRFSRSYKDMFLDGSGPALFNAVISHLIAVNHELDKHHDT